MIVLVFLKEYFEKIKLNFEKSQQATENYEKLSSIIRVKNVFKVGVRVVNALLQLQRDGPAIFGLLAGLYLLHLGGVLSLSESFFLFPFLWEVSQYA